MSDEKIPDNIVDALVNIIVNNRKKNQAIKIKKNLYIKDINYYLFKMKR